MKKLLLMILLVLGTVCEALPVGNPANTELYGNNLWFGNADRDPCDPSFCWRDYLDIRLGFSGNYVFDRHLRVVNNNGNVQSTQIFTNAGLLVFNICDWLNLFATVGVTNFYSSGLALNSNNQLVQIELDFSPTLSYSGGGRFYLWDLDDFYLGVEGQYFYSKSKLDSFVPYGTGIPVYLNSDREAGYGEWQVSLASSYAFVNHANFSLIPYAAIQFSGVFWDLSRISTNALALGDEREQKIAGWTLGMTALLLDRIGVSVEGRFANEKAISVISQLSF